MTPLLLIAVDVAACLLAAWRAATIDSAAALNAEYSRQQCRELDLDTRTARTGRDI